MATLTPIVMVIRGFPFLPFFVSVSVSVFHLVCLFFVVVSGYQSWQYVNPMNYNVSMGVVFKLKSGLI